MDDFPVFTNLFKHACNRVIIHYHPISILKLGVDIYCRAQNDKIRINHMEFFLDCLNFLFFERTIVFGANLFELIIIPHLAITANRNKSGRIIIVAQKGVQLGAFGIFRYVIRDDLYLFYNNIGFSFCHSFGVVNRLVKKVGALNVMSNSLIEIL